MRRLPCLALPCVVLSRVALPRLGLPRLGLRCSALRCRDVLVRLSHITSASALSWLLKRSEHRLARRFRHTALILSLSKGGGGMAGSGGDVGACLHLALRQAQDEVKAGRCGALALPCPALSCLALRCPALGCVAVLCDAVMCLFASPTSPALPHCLGYSSAQSIVSRGGFANTALILSLSKGGGGMTGSGGDVGACLHPGHPRQFSGMSFSALLS